MTNGQPDETEDAIDCALVCLGEPYCTFNDEQMKYAQERNCIWCSRVYVDSKGNAECVEPYFEEGPLE